MSVVCEEIFDEASHPSAEEIRDYAVKLGIDPDSESHLLPLASEGLMKALPPGWKPCYDDKSKSYYYYNNITKKTQWEHPLDDIYRTLVQKARNESQSFSINDHTEDATFVKDDDMPSFDESLPKKLEPLPLRRKEIRLSPLKMSPVPSPKHESKLLRQRSEDCGFVSSKLIKKFNSLDEDNKNVGTLDKHPKVLDKLELKVSGGGSMFLKSNTKKLSELVPSSSGKIDMLDLPKSILRDRNILEHSRSMEFDKLSLTEKSEKDDEDKKSVRFNLDNNTTEIGTTISEKSSSEDDINISDKPKPNEIINIKIRPNNSRFSVSPVAEPLRSLKLIKPNPGDFVKPKLTLSKSSDSDEDTKSLEKLELKDINELFDSDDSSPDEKDKFKLNKKSEKKLNDLKEKIWKDKNEELLEFKRSLERSHKDELNRIMMEEELNYEQNLKTEMDKVKLKLDLKTKEDRLNLEGQIELFKQEFESKLKSEEEKLKEHFELKKEELEKYYEEKLVDIERELADKVEKTKEEMVVNHNANVEQLKQNHAILIEDLRREFRVEEQIIKQEHQTQMATLIKKLESEMESQKAKSTIDERQFEKLRCEKRLLEDKYRCLKEKYLRLKTDVKITIEKRNKRKEQSSTNTTATNTTGSETEPSHSNNKDRTPLNSPSRKVLEKPPTHSHPIKLESKQTKQVIIQDIDTSLSDNCYQSDEKTNQNDSSDSTNPGRSRKKSFTRLKSSSTSRINLNSKSKKGQQRSCSPVENLRRQLQKLEDLEDQFPQNSQSDTYHLRYPFSDNQKFEGSSELEFFRHRIHLERDSIKRAKESLRTQKALFQQRQKELKLKHGTMARHTLQQLCQEEKELTDMEVNLHRTRSLLGEKVIRLRHLEQSLHRANSQNEQQDEATLSDLSSHSASSGISSTEFGEGVNNCSRALLRGDFQESSEIIQSLENLNFEIREIWDVLRTQQQQSNIAQAMPSFIYPDLGWPVLAGTASVPPAPPSIPTLADRLHNYRQHVALANAQSTVVTHASQGATTTLVERTRNLRHWLRQTGMESTVDLNPSQTNL
ncbi:uncharacterized protein LOC132704499 isoform X2 [Cylas formicarius]|uniref:uncharacterized protein LOC132704499 isoform X2 n=1 Tax=Cylas formicarius TaxID=197179 RepID=UPI002958B708|nr:uncharacterized protein LOC132704499 isoform X2 [Cylas formicarius]